MSIVKLQRQIYELYPHKDVDSRKRGWMAVVFSTCRFPPQAVGQDTSIDADAPV